MQTIFGKILEVCVSMQHGGTFLILPKSHPSGEYDLKYKVQATDVAERLRQNHRKTKEIEDVLAVLRAEQTLSNDIRQEQLSLVQRASDEIRKNVTYLERYSESLAFLSSTDGCVVLDQALNVLGFGAKINHVKLPGKRKAVFQHFGMRHRSAAAVCSRIQGASAFVVSQDGDITVFHHGDVFQHKSRLKTNPF